MPIYGDLYQNLQWSLTFHLKVVTHLKSASEASYDVINMATIIRNCPLKKVIVCVGMVRFIQHERYKDCELLILFLLLGFRVTCRIWFFFFAYFVFFLDNVDGFLMHWFIIFR